MPTAGSKLPTANSSQATLKAVPKHVAIIMDGNGRWAQQRGKNRSAGHKEGVKSVRKITEAALKAGVECVTLFAFSSENWQRPETEVKLLMELFLFVLKREVKKLHKNNIRLQIIGARDKFDKKILKALEDAETLTASNTAMNLFVAADYGGKWDISNAVKHVAEKVAAGEITPEQIDEDMISQHVAMADYPLPDLFIRTGGEKRISNFLIWQLAYAELYFTDILWPDFGKDQFADALEWFESRQRRFGKTGEQIEEQEAKSSNQTNSSQINRTKGSDA